MKPWAAVCRFGGIGDDLMAASVLAPLARTHNVEVITEMPCGVVFENNPHIAKLSFKEKGQLPMNDALAWQKWFKDRGGEYDRLVNLSHSCETLVALSPAQTQYHWPQAWRQKWCDRNYLEVVHDIVGVPYEFGPLFHPTVEEAQRAADTRAQQMAGDGPLIGWVLAGSRLDKVYPEAGIAIARLLRDIEGSQVCMFGAPGREFEMAKAIQIHVQKQNGTDAGLHLALSPDANNPSWPIRRSLSQVQVCDVVVGPDTGPMWAVAFEAMPKILLLSHASATNIAKHWRNTVALAADPERVPCYPCHRLIDDPADCRPNAENTAAACISDISVPSIVEMVRRVLAAARDGTASPDRQEHAAELIEARLTL